jgi:MFS transporter, NRE family, putaive nickel resistance protein
LKYRSIINSLQEPFTSLQNKTFAKLYVSQTISLLGDAFSWVGLALLSYEISPTQSSTILATALTLRVTAYILFSPFAGVLADKMDRKTILFTTHFIRMAIIFCLPFIDREWHIYVLVFLLNVFNAFFTPTYRAVLPYILEEKYYRGAIGLSTATFQLLGIVGPAVAGFIAVWLGARQIFFLDGISYILAAMLILTISKEALQKQTNPILNQPNNTWSEVMSGIQLLFTNKIIRFALAIEFVSAIAGAMILVNTIHHIKNALSLGDKEYGWVMAAFGIGATLSAFLLGSLDKSKTRRVSLIYGAFLLSASICFANFVSFSALMALWVLAGLGQSLAEMPSETLIAENISTKDQGKVYGSHFAFSHLWWAFAYPIAGYLGNQFVHREFLYGGILALLFALLTIWFLNPKQNEL